MNRVIWRPGVWRVLQDTYIAIVFCVDKCCVANVFVKENYVIILTHFRAVEAKIATVYKQVVKANKMTTELKDALRNATTMEEVEHLVRDKSTNRPHPSGAAPPWPHQPLLFWPHSLAPPGLNLAA